MQPGFSLHRLYYKLIAYAAYVTLSIPATLILLYYGKDLAEELFRKGETRCEDTY